MKKKLQYWFEYIFFRIFVGIQAITPFWLMYIKSDVVAFLLFNVIGYRRKISYTNLKNSFPDKSEQEIKQIQKRFYHHLADVFFETAKGMTCNADKLCRRYRILNPEIADKYAEKGTHVIFLATHYGNWEWGMQCFNRHLKHQCISLYLPLNNKWNEKYGYKKRTRTGMKLIPVQKTKEAFAGSGDKALGFIMAADQTPSNMNKCHWIDFLNQPTPCIHGPEAYGRKLNIPQLFVDVRKTKRGHYEITLKEIPFDPQNEPAGKLTCRYMKQLEDVLEKEPAYWLWSHRRWKRKVPADIDKIKIQCT
ncbi:MAG: lysophospholipid acyltransferase family protein [Bacteroidales bacterium]